MTYDQKYQLARDNIARLLSGKANEDTATIIIYIHNCSDNDILADLHCYFLTSQYDYLREKSADPACEKKWLGKNQAGDVVSTTQAWAMLEKAITLKMAKNAETTTNIADESMYEHARELEQTDQYFTKTRKPYLPANQNSETDNHFSNVYDDSLAPRDSKHLKKP